MDHRRFSDFAEEEKPLDGKKIKIEDILNLEILVVGHSIKCSRYNKNNSGRYLTIQLELEGQIMVVFTGSDVLISQFEKYGDQIPFLAVIKKINKYYILS